MNAVPPSLLILRTESRHGGQSRVEWSKRAESRESASQTSGRFRALGVTNYINADGTSSDCCIYRKIAPLLSFHPSLAVQRGPRHIKRMKQVRDAYGRRRERPGEGQGKQREANESAEKRIRRERRRDEVDSPEQRCEGGGIRRVRGPTITGHQSRESPASRRESATAP